MSEQNTNKEQQDAAFRISALKEGAGAYVLRSPKTPDGERTLEGPDEWKVAKVENDIVTVVNAAGHTKEAPVDGFIEFQKHHLELAKAEGNAEENSDAAPRSELIDSVEAKESPVLEEVREDLGAAAIEAAAISEPEAAEDTPEAKDDLPEDVNELIGTFHRRAGEEVESLLGKTTGETNILEELTNAISKLRYGNVENKSQFIQQQMDLIGQLRSAFQQDSESDLRSIVSRFHGELDEAVETVKKEEATTDDLFSKARRLRDASDEIEMSSRSINGQSDDLVAETSALMRTYEDFLNDSWGSETYVALIGHKLNAIEDFLMGRRRSLMRVQNELPTLQSAMK